MSTQRSSATDLGLGLITALAERDFPRLADTLTPDVRMRALIPPGPLEISGAEAAAAKFSAWFADAEELELIRSGSDTVADRLHVFYREGAVIASLIGWVSLLVVMWPLARWFGWVKERNKNIIIQMI